MEENNNFINYFDDSEKNIKRFIKLVNEEKNSSEEIFTAFKCLTESISLEEISDSVLNLYSENYDRDFRYLSFDNITLAQGDDFLLALKFYSNEVMQKELETTAGNWLLGVIGNGILSLDMYSVESPLLDNGEYQQVSLTKKNTISLKRGNTIVVKPNQDCIFLKNDSPVLCLSFSMKPIYKQTHVFNLNKLDHLYSRIALMHDSRKVFQLQILRLIGILKDEDFNVVEKLLDHDSHFVRWEAVKTLAHFGFQDMEKVLNKMLYDNNPKIREASELSLNGYAG